MPETKRMNVAAPDFRPFSRPELALEIPIPRPYSGKNVSTLSERTLMYRTIRKASNTLGSALACARRRLRSPGARGTAFEGASITRMDRTRTEEHHGG